MNRIRILAAKTALAVALATDITAPIYASIPTIDTAKHYGTGCIYLGSGASEHDQDDRGAELL